MMMQTEGMTSNPIYCADYSLAAGENLFGSATQTDGYILVESSEAWGEKALDESLQIPQPVKDRLKQYGKAHPTVKVLLVRASRPFVTPGLRCFIARTREQEPALYTFTLSSYEALLDLDFSAVLAGDAAYQDQRTGGPLILVCTNGRRDFCCARQGVAAINALVSLTHALPDTLVMHSSHMGGHRFAANVLCLPDGLLYGRVGLEQAATILEACQQGQVYLPNLRGRTCYPPVVQAADYYVRSQTGLTALTALRWLDAEETSPGEWLVRFATADGGEQFPVRVRVGQAKSKVFESCRLDKTVSITTFEFVG